jgi:uncharacterized RDD family membrane protein YckC
MNTSFSGGIALCVSATLLAAVLIFRRLGYLHTNRTYVAPALPLASDPAAYPLASFGRRAAAWLIDFSIVAIIALSLELALALRSASSAVTVHFSPAHSVGDIALLVGYFGLATYLGKGQTPGKYLLKLRVVSVTHGHLSLWHCVERALGYGASALEAGFGFWQYFVHPNHQTVHDRIAETIVLDLRESSRHTV